MDYREEPRRLEGTPGWDQQYSGWESPPEYTTPLGGLRDSDSPELRTKENGERETLILEEENFERNLSSVRRLSPSGLKGSSESGSAAKWLPENDDPTGTDEIGRGISEIFISRQSAPWHSHTWIAHQERRAKILIENIRSTKVESEIIQRCKEIDRKMMNLFTARTKELSAQLETADATLREIQRQNQELLSGKKKSDAQFVQLGTETKLRETLEKKEQLLKMKNKCNEILIDKYSKDVKKRELDRRRQTLVDEQKVFSETAERTLRLLESATRFKLTGDNTTGPKTLNAYFLPLTDCDQKGLAMTISINDPRKLAATSDKLWSMIGKDHADHSAKL